MRKEHLIGIVILLLVAGGVFAVYEFYLKERLELYAENQQRLDQLGEKYLDLKEKFNNTEPKAVIEDVKNRVVPWREAVGNRAEFFNMADFREIEPVPDNELSYKVYYMQRAPDVASSFNEFLQDEGKYDTFYVDPYFGAPNAGGVNDLSPGKEDVEAWLEAMKFGQSFTRVFVDANALSLRQMNLWMPWVSHQVLKCYTAGVEMEMTMVDLVAFLDKMRFDRERFVDVNAIRIRNPYLKNDPYQGTAYATDPWLQVEMLVTFAEFDPNAPVQVTRSGQGASGGMGGMLFGGRRGDDDDDDDRAAPQYSFMDRLVRLFPF